MSKIILSPSCSPSSIFSLIRAAEKNKETTMELSSMDQQMGQKLYVPDLLMPGNKIDCRGNTSELSLEAFKDQK